MADRKLVLFVFIDAFGWKVLERHPFLEEELPVRNPLRTVFGYSSTCIPTILTGSLPREHGHFSSFFLNPKGSPFKLCRLLSFLPASITRRGRVRHLMSRFIGRLYGFTGYFQIYNMPFRWLPLFDYVEKKDLYQPGGIANGQPTIFDRIREKGVPFLLSDWRASEETNLAELKAACGKGEICGAYLYMARLDGLLHDHGPGGPEIGAKVAWYAERLRDVLETARRSYDDVRMFVFSDHGQAEVREEIDLMGRIQDAGLEYGEDYLGVFDSTMARLWFPKEGGRERMEAVLKQEPRGRILSEEQLRDWGCDFSGNKYGELIFLVDPGVLINPSFMGETRLNGMHGYSPEDADSTAMFAGSHEPAVRPESLTDLHAMMLSEVERLTDSGQDPGPASRVASRIPA